MKLIQIGKTIQLMHRVIKYEGNSVTHNVVSVIDWASTAKEWAANMEFLATKWEENSIELKPRRKSWILIKIRECNL